MLDIIGKKKIWFSVSGLVAVAGIIALFVWGLNFNIDFTGGSLSEISFTDSRPSVEEVSTSLENAGITQSNIQPSGENNYIIRFENVTEEQHQTILNEFNNNLPEYREDRFESIGPIIGEELKRKAVWSIIIVLIAIILYIAYAFRQVSRPVASWKYGVSAIVALAHDLIIIVGLYAIVSYFTGWQVDSLFITALLTILGFSVHDTIVTFDRARELLKQSNSPSEKFEEIINQSVNNTITRSINTSVTTLFVLVAIFFFGGETIKHFVFALILGVIVGTYSSIFIAAPALIVWRNIGKKS